MRLGAVQRVPWNKVNSYFFIQLSYSLSSASLQPWLLEDMGNSMKQHQLEDKETDQYFYYIHWSKAGMFVFIVKLVAIKHGLFINMMYKIYTTTSCKVIKGLAKLIAGTDVIFTICLTLIMRSQTHTREIYPHICCSCQNQTVVCFMVSMVCQFSSRLVVTLHI